MGQCYCVLLKVETKDEQGAVKALQDKLARAASEHTNYSLEHYAEIGIGTDTLPDLLKIFFGGWNAKLRPVRDGLESAFDASYGWGRVMATAFEAMAPHLKDGSRVDIDADDGLESLSVKGGEVIWENE